MEKLVRKKTIELNRDSATPNTLSRRQNEVKNLLTPANAVYSLLNSSISAFEEHMSQLIDKSVSELKTPCDSNLRRVKCQIQKIQAALQGLDEKSRHDPLLKQKFEEVESYTDSLEFIQREYSKVNGELQNYKHKISRLTKENTALRMKLKTVSLENMRKSYEAQTCKTKNSHTPNALCLSIRINRKISPSPVAAHSVAYNRAKASVDSLKGELKTVRATVRSIKKKQFEIRKQYENIDSFFESCHSSYCDYMMNYHSKRDKTDYTLVFQMINQLKKRELVGSSIWKTEMELSVSSS